MEIREALMAGLENRLPVCGIPLGPGVTVLNPNLFVQAGVRTLKGQYRKIQRDHPQWLALREKAQRDLLPGNRAEVSLWDVGLLWPSVRRPP